MRFKGNVPTTLIIYNIFLLMLFAGYIDELVDFLAHPSKINKSGKNFIFY